MQLLTVGMAVSMLLFVVITAPLAHRRWAKDEPTWILLLSELALVYTALDSLLLGLSGK